MSFLFFSYLSRGKRAEAKPCKYINDCIPEIMDELTNAAFSKVVVSGMLPTSSSNFLDVSTYAQAIFRSNISEI